MRLITILQLACHLLLRGFEVESHHFLIYKALVSESQFSFSAVRKETVRMSFIGACSRCLELPWCVVACRKTSTSFVLSDLLVSGGANDTEATDKLECFTKRRAPELFPSKLASVYNHSMLQRTYSHPELLLGGIHDFDLAKCYFGGTISSWKPWVTFDLGQSSNVTKVIVRTQPRGTPNNKFHRVDIRLSSVPGSNPFDNEPLFAKHYETPKRNQEIVLTPNSSMIGRYLTFKQNSGYQMQFCHMEVFGNYVY